MTASPFLVPVDAAARERAISDLSTNLIVEAGAGTGKTTLLVQRLLYILRSGAASIEEVVAITFTEKAAAELRSRLRAELERESRAAAGEERARLRDALEHFDQAQIDTIHAFAGTLLRSRPVEARLDPAFEMLDQLGADLSFDEAWNTWLDSELAGAPEAVRRALNLGLDLARLRQAAEMLQQQRDLLPERWQSPEPEPRSELVAWLQEQVAELDRLAASCRNDTDRGVVVIREIGEWAAIAVRASDEGFERLLAQMERFKPAGNQTNWKPKEDCAAQKQLVVEIDERLEEARQALGQAATAGVATWLGGFVRTYAEKRQQSGRAEFQDLLLWARDLLRDSLAARAYFQRRFKFILVDEFQDTDPLQVEIVFFLAEDGARAATWQEVVPAPGKLFIVGDPKQAIYRFRRADIRIYQMTRDALLRSGGQELQISQNFRSVEPLIDWVNRVFERLIGAGEPPYQAAYDPLSPSFPAHPGWEQRAVVALYPRDGRTAANAGESRLREARALARLVHRLVEEESWPVRERGAGDDSTSRPARYRDVALLFSTTTEMELFEDALQSDGVPFRVEGGRLFYHRQEVRDLVNCLTAIDDPTDRIALVATLISPSFAFAEEELFLFTDEGHSLDYLVDPGDGWPRFRDAFALLRRLHEGRAQQPADALVEALLTETRMAELALLGPSGDQIAANLFKVVEQARAFGGRSGATFRGFVRWLRDNQRRPPRESDSPVAEEGDDTVRLMTMHAAKGLEFPIVLLANARTGQRTESCIVDHLAGTIDFRLGDEKSIFRTPGFADAADREKLHGQAEAVRLMYVACTRARDHLVVPLFDPSRGFAAQLGDGVPVPGSVAPGDSGSGVWVYDGALLTSA